MGRPLSARKQFPLSHLRTIFLLALLFRSSQSIGINRTAVPGNNATEPVCSSIYQIKMATLTSHFPEFQTPDLLEESEHPPCPSNTTWSSKCGCRDESTTAGGEDACTWVPSEFLASLYNRSMELMRHGVPGADAYQVFLHARGVLYNYQVCSPIANAAGSATIPIALDAFYGLVTAQLQAKYSSGLLSAPQALSSELVTSITSMAGEGGDMSVDLEFPEELLVSSDLVNGVLEGTLPNPPTPSRFFLQSSSRQNFDPSQNCSAISSTAKTWNLREYPMVATHANEHCCAAV